MIKACVISLAVGVVVGVLYYVLRVRSPAPPLVALVGLLGMLAGERLVPMAQVAFIRIAPLIGRHTPPPTAPPGD
jgi:XapX domain-containing protein